MNRRGIEAGWTAIVEPKRLAAIAIETGLEPCEPDVGRQLDPEFRHVKTSWCVNAVSVEREGVFWCFEQSPCSPPLQMHCDTGSGRLIKNLQVCDQRAMRGVTTVGSTTGYRGAASLTPSAEADKE